MNTGPLTDGSIRPVDVKTLKDAGRRIRAEGWPVPAKPDSATPPAPKKKKDKAAPPAE